MRCHQCNQDSIKIDNGHILCDVCGLDIDVSFNLEDSLYDLFIYNETLQAAEELGKEALIKDKVLEDNPYTIDSDQIMMHKRWELGYNREKEGYEFTALSLSSEKIENELRFQIKQLKAEKIDNKYELNNFLTINDGKISKFCSKLSNKKILGRILKKEVSLFKKEYEEYCSDYWKVWKRSDK